MNIKGKVAIVTGASSGIGLATARLLAKKGMRVALVARSKTKLTSLAKDLPGSLSVPTDMSKEAQVKNMIKKVNDHFGRVDVLINNAGRGYDASVEEIDPNKFKDLFELDLLGPVIAMQEAIPIMRKQKEGIIVNISSGTALITLPSMSAYASIKSALGKLSLTAREELAKDNIKVCVVYPYITRTNFEKNTWRESGKYEEFDEGNLPAPIDNPETVAEKILEAIKSGKAETFLHDWMKRLS